MGLVGRRSWVTWGWGSGGATSCARWHGGRRGRCSGSVATWALGEVVEGEGQGHGRCGVMQGDAACNVALGEVEQGEGQGHGWYGVTWHATWCLCTVDVAVRVPGGGQVPCRAQ